MYKDVLKLRCQTFNSDVEKYSKNEADSPIFEMLKSAILYGLYQEVMYMVNMECQYTKKEWSNLVWEKAWRVEKMDRSFSREFFETGALINEIMCDSNYLIWWEIGDCCPELMLYCEVLAKIVCRTSRLKSDDYTFKDQLISIRSCELCNQFIAEDVKHVVLECDRTEHLRVEMFEKIQSTTSIDIVNRTDNILFTLLGRNIPDVPIQEMMKVWKVSCKYISRMYWKAIANRSGIG